MRTLAVMTMTVSTSTYGQLTSVDDVVKEDKGALQVESRPERFFSESPQNENHATQSDTLTSSETPNFPRLLPDWLHHSSGPSALLTLTPIDPQSRDARQVRDVVLQRGGLGNYDVLRHLERACQRMPTRGNLLGEHSLFMNPQDTFIPTPLVAGENSSNPDSASNEIKMIRFQDHFVVIPQLDIVPSAINEGITLRYQNPATIRAIHAMSEGQALQFFLEISETIDARALTPTSYNVRIRRALINLSVALDNEAFVKGLGLSRNSFTIDGFRETLNRLYNDSQIQNRQDAVGVLNTVITSAQSLQGVTAAVVCFEFANASIDTLDKFSGLVPADPSSQIENENGRQNHHILEEEIVGIGLEVREHAKGLLVVMPIRGGPAVEAGIEPGDIILSIDGRDLRGMNIASSMELLRGALGSQMWIRISRHGGNERDIVLTRRIVRVWSVNDAKILSGTDIGYFSISRFSQSTTEEVDQALNDLYSQGMKSLIIDLRGNPGGLLTTCVEVCDRFLPCGIIVSTKGRLSSDNIVEEASYSKSWNVPVVVLIDEYSASASEIFAAAIQENNRGLVAGTRSYGKGKVQTHFPLTSIQGDLRLTTALFYSPTGHRMSGRGVIPDVQVFDRDGVINGDEVLAEAARIAQDKTIRELSEAAGICPASNVAPIRSSLLHDIVDPRHPWTTIL